MNICKRKDGEFLVFLNINKIVLANYFVWGFNEVYVLDMLCDLSRQLFFFGFYLQKGMDYLDFLVLFSF